MTSRLHKQRADLVARIHHAKIAHDHGATLATRQAVDNLTARLRRMDDLLTAVRHGKVRVGSEFQQNDGIFITQAEYDARHRLNEDRRIVYL